jgi:MFS family permease
MAASGTPEWGAYGRHPVRILALVGLVDAVDRGVLPGVLTHVQDDLGFSDFQAGVLGTALVLAGFVVVLPAGYLADRHRRTRIIAAVLASWGAISLCNAMVRSFWQFVAVRATLGIGETIDNPASQSLLADYYPTTVRGRAYALQRVAPLIGTALGTGLGGAIGATLGWRWAFLVVGVPGSLLAIAVWRLPEPRRGEHDGIVETSDPSDETAVARPLPAPADPADRNVSDDVRTLLAIRSLRSLMVGMAVASGALSGIGFWAPSFFERHTTLTSGQASGVVAVMILAGALCGTLLGGVTTDRLARRDPSAPMQLAARTQAAGAVVLILVFLPTPLVLRIPLSVLGVLLTVTGFPALVKTISEVVDPAIRGLAFSVSGFLSALASAASPLVIGFLADRFELDVDGETKGNLANAFLIVTPLVFVGAFVLSRGHRYVTRDAAAASAAAAAA